MATRERITGAALKLFLRRGYESTTMDEIAAEAGVSRRSLFHYFPTKEDVVFSRQDDLGPGLERAVAARPLEETWPRLVEAGLAHVLVALSTPETLAMQALYASTAALRARHQLRFVRLEAALGRALLGRARNARERTRAGLIATLGIGALRMELERHAELGRPLAARELKRSLRRFWTLAQELGEEALAVA